MQILVIGQPESLNECQLKFGDKHQFVLAETHDKAESFVRNIDLIIDFELEEDPVLIQFYQHKKLTVLVNSVLTGLQSMLVYLIKPSECTFFGFNGLNTFINQASWEVCLARSTDEPELDQLMKKLDTSFQVVADRVGFVAPRVICMIINEAFYTVQEGTASKEDIDQAMKLGTNYPYGPFEWCEKLGVIQVYELLDAVYNDTKDERYKIAPLLKQSYLQALQQYR